MTLPHDDVQEVPVAGGHRLKKGAIGLVGVLFMALANAALVIRGRDPEQYLRIGRTVLEEAHERV